MTWRRSTDARLEVHAGIGRVEVIVPARPRRHASTVASRAPDTWPCWVGDEGGIDLEDRATLDGGDDVPQLDLEAWVGVGEVEVTTR